MRENFIFSLKQPCRNRGVKMVDNKDGSVSLDGTRLETAFACENYLEKCPRIDFEAGK